MKQYFWHIVWQCPPPLQLQKSIFDGMTETIDTGIISSQTFTAFTRWYDWLDAIFCERFHQSITVIFLIRQKIFSGYSFNRSARLRAIHNGTCCDKHSDRHAMAHPRPDASLS